MAMAASRRAPRGALAMLFSLSMLAGILAIALDWSAPARAGIIALLCLVLWLTEWVPVWLPTLVLWTAVPLVFAEFGSAYTLPAVLGWSADPVLLLFLCGFTLAAAAQRWGLDRWLVMHVIHWSGGKPYRLIAIAAFTTAGLSMWMSNIAAAALVFGALRPVLVAESTTDRFRRALLLAVTMAANVGGVATPIGSGPNGIAMATVEQTYRIGFIDWMAFGVPLAFGLVTTVVVMVLIRFRPTGHLQAPVTSVQTLGLHAWILCVLFAATVALWLTERLHGWPTWSVALGTIAAILVTGLLGPRDARQIDWSTLLLIAGGIALGTLLDRSGTVHLFASWLPLDTVSPFIAIIGLCVASAFLSALMSNTATATLLIPFAATVDPSPAIAILVAVAASLGVPFVISTPPNAMAVANGLPSRDLLVPGLLLLVGGCIVVALTGPWVLHAVGIP